MPAHPTARPPPDRRGSTAGTRPSGPELPSTRGCLADTAPAARCRAIAQYPNRPAIAVRSTDLGGLVHEDAHLPNTRRQSGRDGRRFVRRDIPRAGRVEVEAQRRRPSLDRRQRVLAIGDAADLHHHAVTQTLPRPAAPPPDPPISSGARPPGRPDSPPRAAAAISCAERMPLSLTFSTPGGMRGASRSEVSSVTSNVVRSRLLTPTISAPASRAFASSRSSCTSTSAAIP